MKLTHKKHAADYKVKCADCHHEYKDGKNVWKDTDPVKKCSVCHDPEEKKGTADKLQNGLSQELPGLSQGAEGQGGSLTRSVTTATRGNSAPRDQHREPKKAASCERPSFF